MDKFIKNFLAGSIISNFIYLFKWNLGVGITGYYVVFIIMYLLWVLVRVATSNVLDEKTPEQLEKDQDKKDYISQFEDKEFVRFIIFTIVLFVMPFALLTSISFLSGIMWIKILTFYFGV